MDLQTLYKRFSDNHKMWENAWLEGQTDWWPDSIAIPGIVTQKIMTGSPSSDMPDKAQCRVNVLKSNGEIYVTNITTGVHAYRIGFVSEYT